MGMSVDSVSAQPSPLRPIVLKGPPDNLPGLRWVMALEAGSPWVRWVLGLAMIAAGCELARAATSGWFEHPESTLIMVGLSSVWTLRCAVRHSNRRCDVILFVLLMLYLSMDNFFAAALVGLAFPFAYVAMCTNQRHVTLWLTGIGVAILAMGPILLFQWVPESRSTVSNSVFNHCVSAVAFSLLYVAWMRLREPELRFSAAGLALYLCPWQAPILEVTWGSKEWLQGRRQDLPNMWWGLLAGLMLLGKAWMYHGLYLWFPTVLGDHLIGAELLALSTSGLWGMAALRYLEWYLLLSICSDLIHTIARLAGFGLSSNFRYPLLAWSPVELWRRWSIWNRLFLLRMIYFPMGGNQRHMLLNIILVFLGSLLLFHGGYIGGVRWGWDPEFMGSWFAYLMVQALLVCGEVLWWRRQGRDRPKSIPSLRDPRRWVGMLLFQGFSTWLHVLILLPWGIGLDERVSILFRMLGIR